MGKQIHKMVTPEGDRYRVWSDNSNYVSQVMTFDQLKLYEQLMTLRESLNRIHAPDSPTLGDLQLNQWIKQGETVAEWQEEFPNPPSTTEAEKVYKEMEEMYKKAAKDQVDFLRKAADVWEKFYLNGIV